MASEFLLIAGTEWTELQDAPAKFASVGSTMAEIQDAVENHLWNVVSNYMEELGLVQPNQIIQSAKLINTFEGESNYRFWYIV